MHKKKRRRRAKNDRKTFTAPEPGLLETYLSDPIALWQDGEYEALDALYARPDGGIEGKDMNDSFCGIDIGKDGDDSIPF